MARLLQDAIRAILGVLLLVPMPWRAGLVIGIVALGSYQVLRRLLSLFLLPEFWITTQLRRLGRRPLPGTYAFGDFIGWSIKASRWLAWLGVIVAGVGITAWYVRPSIEDTILARYVDQSVTWWYSLERWVFTSQWSSSAHAGSWPNSKEPFEKSDSTTTTPGATAPPRARTTPMRRPSRSPTATPAYETYVVQPGDSLSKIAKRFSTSVEDIVAANRIRYPSLVTNPARIEIGWRLRIPRGK